MEVRPNTRITLLTRSRLLHQDSSLLVEIPTKAGTEALGQCRNHLASAWLETLVSISFRTVYKHEVCNQAATATGEARWPQSPTQLQVTIGSRKHWQHVCQKVRPNLTRPRINYPGTHLPAAAKRVHLLEGSKPCLQKQTSLHLSPCIVDKSAGSQSAKAEPRIDGGKAGHMRQKYFPASHLRLQVLPGHPMLSIRLPAAATLQLRYPRETRASERQRHRERETKRETGGSERGFTNLHRRSRPQCGREGVAAAT